MNLTAYAIQLFEQSHYHMTGLMTHIDVKDIEISEGILTGIKSINEIEYFEWNHEPEVTKKMGELRAANQ